MLVISDASPLNVLIRIERVALLPKLFNGVVIPPGCRAIREIANKFFVISARPLSSSSDMKLNVRYHA